MQLNADLLNLILLVQSYKNLKIDESIFLKKESNWQRETERYYYSLGKKTLGKLGLNTSKHCFERVLDYQVTNKMLSAESNELSKFTFVKGW